VRRLKDNKKYNFRHGTSKTQTVQGREMSYFSVVTNLYWYWVNLFYQTAFINLFLFNKAHSVAF